MAAWIGLTPGQYSSGGTTRLARITKAGDKYLRSLLVRGAKAILERLVVEKILTHLGLDPQPPPMGRARQAGQDFST